MDDFAIIAEGYTDQVVIENILQGYFEDHEPGINFEQPLEDTTGQHAHKAPGGWDQVVKYFELGRYKQALQFNRYLVVHIDTDALLAEKTRLELKARDDKGEELSPKALIAQVVEKFHAIIGEEILAAHGDRFIFAVAVHATECWLLPLVFPDQKQKRAKTTGCFEAIDTALKKRGIAPLKKGEGKNPEPYKLLSVEYTRRKALMKSAPLNPSLDIFVHELERRAIKLEEST